MKKGIHQTAFVEDDDSEADLLRFDGAGQASRAGSDHQYIGARLGMRTKLGLGLNFNFGGGEKIGHGIS